jgi:hypothetical protein
MASQEPKLMLYTRVFNASLEYLVESLQERKQKSYSLLLQYWHMCLICSNLVVQEDIDGHQVEANGHFEFVICRGDKRVGIVEAKKG